MNLLEERLFAELHRLGRAAIAFSGGCDSTLLAEAARRALGREAVCLLLADSPFLPRVELARAVAFARERELPFEAVVIDPLASAAVRANPADRCYHCKKLIFSTLAERGRRLGYPVLMDGTNYDDLGDERPGMRAAAELGVAHPLLSARLRKAEVRSLAHEYGLSIWDLPAAACLATRIATGCELTLAQLRQVEAAEAAVAELGFRGFRVRHRGASARLELLSEEFLRGEALSVELKKALKRLGFVDVQLAIKAAPPIYSGGIN